MVALKPHDVAVALKLGVYGAKRPSYSHIAFDLSISPSEVHAAVKRAQASLLLHGSELNGMPNISALSGSHGSLMRCPAISYRTPSARRESAFYCPGCGTSPEARFG